MITRRCFIKTAAVAGGAFIVPQTPWLTRAMAELPGGTLDPSDVPKYRLPMIIPPAMPATARLVAPGGKNIDYYEIAVRQFRQRILPPGLPETTVWSYGSVNHPGTFNFPAFTIEASWRTPVRVKWINDLKHPTTGAFLPHLLPIDPTLHWANPPGGLSGRDSRPGFRRTPGPYTGPVPIVTHVHGGHTHQESDGFTEAWYLPAAANIPGGYARTGTYYDIFKTSSPLGRDWAPGSAVFEYPNDQLPATLWYHDHALGMTRANVYAGPAGFYLLRGGPGDVMGQLPGPAPDVTLSSTPYEIPIAIQDRSFNADGSLFYPDSREFFDGYRGPYLPVKPVSPIWNPEFFGNMMVVNGRTWPFLEVEQRRYRFRLLNGCNSRFLILRLSNGLPFWQIGADSGFLAAPVELGQVLMAPAERADVIVDFTDVPVGTEIVMLNVGPDEPFGGGEAPGDFDAADPLTTGQVMQFRVKAATGRDTSTAPHRLMLPSVASLGPASVTRGLTLNEEVFERADIPIAALLGTTAHGPLMWEDEVTETPALGATEIWELVNFTEDAHPIHVHQVQFQVVNRQPFEALTGGLGPARGPEVWETGYKDTVIAYPGEITRLKATFDLPGLYVWHCHIVEHEDNEMMRPFRVGP